MNVQVHRVSRNWHNPRRRADWFQATCPVRGCSWFEVSVSEADARENARKHARGHEEEAERG